MYILFLNYFFNLLLKEILLEYIKNLTMSKKQFSEQMKLYNIIYDNYDLIFSDKSRLVKYNKKLEDGLILHRHYKKKNFEYEVQTILEILNAFMDKGVKYNKFIKDRTILLNFHKSIDNLSHIDMFRI
jgi:uncharacterized protein with NRDE domain